MNDIKRLILLMTFSILFMIGGGVTGAVLHQAYWQTFVPKPWEHNFIIEGKRTTYYCDKFVGNGTFEKVYQNCISHRAVRYQLVTTWSNGAIVAEPAKLWKDY